MKKVPDLELNLWDERADMREESRCRESSDLNMEFKVGRMGYEAEK